tara:strand:+ start:601 stop:744 length:144 start_codon:yes stop_codon:yes gene_type:complete
MADKTRSETKELAAVVDMREDTDYSMPEFSINGPADVITERICEHTA